MKDDAARRTEICAALNALEAATRICVVRFRRHTAGSALGHVADVVVDEFSGGDAVGDERSGRRGHPGMRVVALDGERVLGSFENHPICEPEFENAVIPAALRAASRIGAVFELWREETLCVSWTAAELAPSRGGYRDAPARVPREELEAAGFEVSGDGTAVRQARAHPPAMWAAVALGALCLAAFPFTALAMLFREPRELLLGTFRRFQQGWQTEWLLETSPAGATMRSSATGKPTTTTQVPRHGAMRAALWPVGYAKDEPRTQLVVIHEGGVTPVESPRPLEPIAAFLQRWLELAGR